MTPLHLATEAARAVGLDPVRTIPGGTGCSFLDTPRDRDYYKMQHLNALRKNTRHE